MDASRAHEAGAGLNLFHAKVFALLALALLADSYDLQATSFAAPVLAKVWHVKPSAFAPLFGAGLAGAFFGSVGFGWLGDRIGRKRAIIAACLVYGGFSLVSTLAQDPTQFAVSAPRCRAAARFQMLSRSARNLPPPGSAAH